jgi:hypothetical protein
VGDILSITERLQEKARARVEADCIADIAALKEAISDLEKAIGRTSPTVAAALMEGAAKLARLVADLETELLPPS